MITKIILNNFKSFKENTQIDLLKTNYAILPGNVSECGVLKGAIFVGANASGKSNIILSIKLLLDFLFRERNMNSGLFRCMFHTNPKYSIDYSFLIDDHNIRYCFEVDTRSNFITENLYVNNSLMLERMGTSAKSYITDANGISYMEDDVDRETLFLRTLYFNTKFAGNSALKAWMDFLSNSIYINLFEKTIISYGKENFQLTQYLKEDGCNHINNFFNDNNFEQNIEYANESHGKNITLKVSDDDNEKSIFFKRKNIDIPIPFSEESLGNQNLLRLLPAFLSVANKSGILLVDEFSSGFHNDLEELMVRYFMQQAKSSQMLFVSHSTNLLSNTLLRPDQEYSVEFNGNQGSSVKRFSSEQPRSGQNIEKMYVSGVFGGLPNYKDLNDEN
ncbi:ATP-binding protein [Anaerocolumna sp. AGMB13025]|uniref:AAA family ATPase n=1 Tax=Anaerocolumna sp. AGMB13025 TaxID=3039116 RepID=UPI00241EC6DB|nr:ATP-binding protein [Anaerocolumna sp. AGMB13025]WFR56737.1 ATP-binding protein [Anaerocolumna sp. AGMB13025]